MINEEFRELIHTKIKNLEKEKRKLQITEKDKQKIKKIEQQQNTLNNIRKYPLSFAAAKASDEEIKYIINLYKTETDLDLEQVNKEINTLTEEWTDEIFLNEVAAYTILNIAKSNSEIKLKNYLNLLKEAHNNHDNLYDLKNITQIINEKISEFPNIKYNPNFENIFLIIKENPDFKSKFNQNIIDYYNQYINTKEQIQLPFSKEIQDELSKKLELLLNKKHALEKKLENYKDFDIKDQKKRKRYIEEITKNIYQTHIDTLPFYATYDLDDFDKLISITEKITNSNDSEQLLETIENYKKQIKEKAEYQEKLKFQSQYQSKYNRFEDINQMLHMGDYSEGDFTDYFALCLYHILQKEGIPFCSSDNSINSFIKRQFDNNEKLIEEVTKNVKKQIDETGIKKQIEKYIKLKNSLINKIHREKIKKLEAEIKEEILSIIHHIRNSYAKEGYEIFNELLFLQLTKTKNYKTSKEEQEKLENTVRRNHNMLFNANYITVVNTKSDILDSKYTFNDIMETKKIFNDKSDKNMQELHMNINKLINENIEENEILFLCELTEQELKQILEENELYKMKAIRQIITEYNNLEDKTLVNDDYQNNSKKISK